MRLSRTLSLYLAWSFLRMILAIFALCYVLISVIDYIEIARQIFSRPGFGPAQAALVSILRVPVIAEIVLPFATLFGAIAALAIANRRLELVVARAAGVSAWQFLLPGALVGLMLGVFASLLFDPFAAAMNRRSVAVEAATRGSIATQVPPPGQSWLYQSGPEGSAIIGAARSSDQGLTLSGVTAFLFDPNGGFRERVDGASAQLSGREWRISNAVVTRSGSDPRRAEVFSLKSTLDESQITQALGDANTVSFWELPQLISLAEDSALPADRFRVKLQRLIAQPLLLLAMVLIAGVVALRFNRQNRLGTMILAGVSAGFVLYVVNEITRDLGASGLVSPVLAAWMPALLSTLVSVSFLLRQEDG